MTIRKIRTEDKQLIKAYVKWCSKKSFFPNECECSRLIENMHCDHRELVEDFLNELRLHQNSRTDEP